MTLSFNPRWTPQRKADVLHNLFNDYITPDEACRQYSLSMEELNHWLARHAAGQTLKTTVRIKI